IVRLCLNSQKNTSQIFLTTKILLKKYAEPILTYFKIWLKAYLNQPWGQSGVVEGFGILSMASVCPILAVLVVGMWVTRKRNRTQMGDSQHNGDSSKQESLKAA
ncbi:MAG: hypothetical protein AB8G05_19335, partial [Oligoflexales bacterium]